MGGGHYEAYLRRLQKHAPNGIEHDQSTHGTEYGDDSGDDRTAAERAASFAHELGDALDDAGEYIRVMTKDGKIISFTNWDEVEAFERRRFQKQGGIPDLIAPISQGDPAKKAPRRGPSSSTGEPEAMEARKVKAYDDEAYWYDSSDYPEYESASDEPYEMPPEETYAWSDETSGTGGDQSQGGGAAPYYPNTVPQAISPTPSEAQAKAQQAALPKPPQSKPRSPVPSFQKRGAMDQAADQSSQQDYADRQYARKLAQELGIPLKDNGRYIKIRGRSFLNAGDAIGYLQARAEDMNLTPERQRMQQERETATGEEEAKQSVPEMAHSKGYGVSEVSGNVKLSTNYGDSLYFDTWAEAEAFLMKAPTYQPKPISKAYTPSPEEQQQYEEENYWENQEQAEQNLEEQQDYAQQQQREEERYKQNQQRANQQYELNERRQSAKSAEQMMRDLRAQAAQEGYTVSRDGMVVQGPGGQPRSFASLEDAYNYVRSEPEQQRRRQSKRNYWNALRAWVGSGKPAATFPGSQPIQKSADETVVSLQKAYGDDEFDPYAYLDEEVSPEGDLEPAEEPTDFVLYENPIQPPAVPPGDPEYRQAEKDAKSEVEAKLIELGGSLHGMAPGFRIEFPEGYEPDESPEFTSWQQAAEWLGVELAKQPVPPLEPILPPAPPLPPLPPEQSLPPMSPPLPPPPAAPMPGRPLTESLTYPEWARRKRLKEGGEGSGNFDHAGRPGEVGGSAPRTGGQATRSQRPKGKKPTGYAGRFQNQKGEYKAGKILPDWRGGPYGGLMRQYLLPRRGDKPAVDYPVFTDLRDDQKQYVEDLIDKNAFLAAGVTGKLLPKSLIDNVLRPMAKKSADILDYLTYDQAGQKLQDYANFGTYLLGIHARDKYGKHVAEKVAAHNKAIKYAEDQELERVARAPKKWIDRETGEVIDLDDPRVPKPPTADVGRLADDRFRRDSVLSRRSWDQLSDTERQAWKTFGNDELAASRSDKESVVARDLAKRAGVDEAGWDKLPQREKQGWVDYARKLQNANENPAQVAFERARQLRMQGDERWNKLSAEKQDEILARRKGATTVGPMLGETPTSRQALRDYQAKMFEWEQKHALDPEIRRIPPRKEMPRWLTPKTQAGKVASYVANPFSFGMNAVVSLGMGFGLPYLANQLRDYAKGDPRAFNPILRSKAKRHKTPIQESDTSDGHGLDLRQWATTWQKDADNEDGILARVIGPAYSKQIIAAMQDMSEDETDMVFALMGYLSEENLASLKDNGELLPTDDEGMPLVSLKAQRAMKMSDEQRERLTPVAVQLATLAALHDLSPVESGAKLQEAEDDWYDDYNYNDNQDIQTEEYQTSEEYQPLWQEIESPPDSDLLKYEGDQEYAMGNTETTIDPSGTLSVPKDDPGISQWLRTERELEQQGSISPEERIVKPLAGKLAEIFEDMSAKDRHELDDTIKSYLNWVYRPKDWDEQGAVGVPPSQIYHKRGKKMEDMTTEEYYDYMDYMSKMGRKRNMRDIGLDRFLKKLGQHPGLLGVARLAGDYVGFPYLAEQLRKYTQGDPSAFNPTHGLFSAGGQDRPPEIHMPTRRWADRPEVKNWALGR